MTNAQFNYVTANRFYVQIEQTIAASFSECSGIGIKIQYDTQLEGGVNDQRRVILGDTEFSDVTLKRGITDSLTFWEWLQTVLDESKKNPRRNVGILLFNQAGETMQSWTLIGAVPVAWKVDSLQASSDSVALESLTLAYEGLRIEGPGSSGFADLSSGRDSSQYFSGKS